MKIALVIPNTSSIDGKSFYDWNFFSKFTFTRKFFSYLLAIPTLAALTPSEHEVRVFDENIENIDYNWGADLVGISVRTLFAFRAYEISRTFRKRGAITVLGGIHPSMCREEALEHCDSVVVGEAEGVWATLLKDAGKGQLKKIYQATKKSDLRKYPIAKRDLLASRGYFTEILQTTKGCPFFCEFCSVYAFDGQKIRSRTLEQVLAEVKEVKGKSSGYKKVAIFFADDNIIANKKFARKLFEALIPLKVNWYCQAAINISKEEKLLKLMKKSGCGSIFVGLESISPDNLVEMDKGVNLKYDYLEAINKIQSHEILVHGSFILGSDNDDQKSFEDLALFIEEVKLLMPMINVLTPFPGTKLFERLGRTGRILHKNWNKYDMKSAVFIPKKMTPEELEREYKKLMRRIYSFSSIYNRLQHYWKRDFWKHSNQADPILFKYRILFALRLCSLLISTNRPRSIFILKILPHVFRKRVRISVILTLMAYNDFAYSI